MEELIKHLEKFKREHPEQVLIVETSEGTVHLKIGMALIYESMNGELVIDSE